MRVALALLLSLPPLCVAAPALAQGGYYGDSAQQPQQQPRVPPWRQQGQPKPPPWRKQQQQQPPAVPRPKPTSPFTLPGDEPAPQPVQEEEPTPTQEEGLPPMEQEPLPPMEEEESLGIEEGGLPPMDEPEEAPPVEDELPPMDEAGDDRDPGVELIASAALGVGSRAFQRPTFRGLQKLPDTPFAAALVSFRTRVWPRDAFSLDFLIAYRTSMGLQLRELPLFALPQDVSVRVSSSELSAAPTFRLGDGPDALSLSVPVGLSMRSFVPVETQYQTPRYLLLGPHLRVELIAPFADILTLRAGPELQWVARVDPTLRRDGVVGSGVAIGAELGLDIAVTAAVSIILGYRESRAFASSKGPLFIDVERFATTGVSGRY